MTVEDVMPTDAVVEDQSVEVSDDSSDDSAEISTSNVETSDENIVEPTSEETDADPMSEETIEEIVPRVAVLPTPDEEKRSIFLPLVLGGIIAGIAGFTASQMNLFGGGDADITTKLRSDLNTYQERLVVLETVEPPVIEMPDLSLIQKQLAALEDRFAELEARPAIVVPEGVDAEAAAAYAAGLEALQSSVKEQRDEIEALLNNAKSVEQATSEAAKEASVQAAVAKIVSAIDAGQPFAASFADLEALDIGEIDPALGAVAAEGVVTLNTLQSEFPDQARAALAKARASGVGEGQQGIGGFLTRALGARSVAPREGGDPDAVLSRAEAAIKAGDLNATLTELDTLPEEAQAAIADWRAAADARVAARAAADALAQRLTAD